MIYMVGKSGPTIIILEPGNLEKLRDEGGIIRTPDDPPSIVIAFSPDIGWTSEQLQRAFAENDGIDAKELDRILEAGRTRPEVKERPYTHTEWLSGRRERQKPQ